MKVEPVTAARPPFVYWSCLWGAGLAIIAVLAAYDLINPSHFIPLGRDFANLYTAGQSVLAGAPWRPFDPNSFRLEMLEHVGALTTQNYSYPPHALFAAVPFAFMPYGVSFWVWTILGGAFFCWAARPVVPFPAILAVLTPAAAINVWAGHYGFFFGGLWLIYFRWLATQPVKAGAVAAILTFKPHMGLFVGLTALTSRTALAVAIIGTGLLVLLSGIAFGWDTWAAFFDTTFNQQVSVLTKQVQDGYFQLMPSAYTALGRNWVGIAAQILTAGAALFMLARYKRIDPFALATATFLVVPYVFVYDMTVACLGFAIMLFNDWGRLSRLERVILSAAFFVPCLNLYFPPASAPILLAALYVQTGMKHRTWRALPEYAALFAVAITLLIFMGRITARMVEGWPFTL